MGNRTGEDSGEFLFSIRAKSKDNTGAIWQIRHQRGIALPFALSPAIRSGKVYRRIDHVFRCCACVDRYLDQSSGSERTLRRDSGRDQKKNG
jgi:hypothetical protein